MKRYLTILSPDEPVEHEWNANEEGGRGTQHEAIRISADPATIRLTWASSADSTSRYIGTFQLFLQELLEDGYIVNDAKPGCVRVKFVNADGEIRIAQGKRTRQYLVVGNFSDQ
mgnify:CR=1 FL=1